MTDSWKANNTAVDRMTQKEQTVQREILTHI